MKVVNTVIYVALAFIGIALGTAYSALIYSLGYHSGKEDGVDGVMRRMK